MPEIIKISIALGTISFIVADAYIFNFFRKWIEDKNKFIGKLFSCGFCFGTELSIIIEIIYKINVINRIPVLDEILTAFILSFFSGIVWLVINIFFDLAKK